MAKCILKKSEIINALYIVFREALLLENMETS